MDNLNINSNAPFSAYIPLTLIKSEKKSDGTIEVTVGGIISDESRDLQGEKLLQDKLETTHIQKGFGRIKYEHGDDPKRFIGFIDKLINKGRETRFEGRIVATPNTAQYDLAKAVIDDINRIQAYNKLHPHDKKKVGWSVEGSYVKKSANGDVRASIQHVVYTTKPVNTNSVVEVLKSLEAGYGYNIRDKTGGNALRLESVDKKIKHHLSTTGTKENKMKYLSKAHCKKELMEKGVKESEAEVQAEELFNKQKDDEGKENDAIAANSKEIVEQLGKSLAEVKSLITSLEKSALTYTGLDEKMEKSLVPSKDGDIEVGDFLEHLGKSLTTMAIENAESVTSLAKSQEGLVNGVLGIAKLLNVVMEKSQDLQTQLNTEIESSMNLRKAIAKYDRGLAPATGDEETIDNSGDTPKVKQLNKALSMKGMRWLIREKQASPVDMQMLESNYLSDAHANKIIEAYNSGKIPL